MSSTSVSSTGSFQLGTKKGAIALLKDIDVEHQLILRAAKIGPPSIPFKRYLNSPVPCDPWTIWSIGLEDTELQQQPLERIREQFNITQSTHTATRLLPASL